MKQARFIGDYPKVGIRPIIDARQGGVRESLEEQTMDMAKNVAGLISSTLKYSDGTPVQCVIADSTIGRVPEAAACAEKFRKEGVGVVISVTPCRLCTCQPTRGCDIIQLWPFSWFRGSLALSGVVSTWQGAFDIRAAWPLLLSAAWGGFHALSCSSLPRCSRVKIAHRRAASLSSFSVFSNIL